MAIVNANYEFLLVDVGANGRASDAGLFSRMSFFSKLKEKKLHIPDPEPLPGSNTKMPFVFVCDDAFPLTDNLMKPFNHNSMQKSELIFNYRLSRARGKVENAFGILASRFRILLTTINMSPEKVTKITLACCYLHNFLRKKNEEVYLAGGFSAENTETGNIVCADWQSEGASLNSISSTTIRNSLNTAKNVRNQFCEYFSNTGAVPWQNKVYEKLSYKIF